MHGSFFLRYLLPVVGYIKDGVCSHIRTQILYLFRLFLSHFNYYIITINI